jgi:NhaC family Na+:H+ antiporter
MKYILAIVSLVIIGVCIVLNIPLYLGFLLAGILNCVYYFSIEKYSMKELVRYYLKGVLEHKIIYLIITLIGAIVSVWISSGVVPSLINYGFDYLNVNHIFSLTFIFTSIISVFMGTALGTISTVGVAIMGIGVGFDVDLNILLGAIVSGSFIADKISPISGLNNLLIVVTETEYKNVIKEMMKTFLPVYLLSLLFFMYMDFHMVTQSNNLEQVNNFKNLINEAFVISPVLLFVPLIIIILPFFKIETKYALLIGVILGSILTIFVQGYSFYETIMIILKGFHINDGGSLSLILNSGGIYAMIEVVLIVMGALGLVGILDGVGLLNEMSNKIVDGIKNRRSLIIRTVLVSSMFTIVTCDQTVGVIIPAKLFKEKFEKFKLKKEVITRVISDSGIVIAPLMPWNVNVIIFSTVLGITSMKFAMYSVLCYLFPIMTLVYVFRIKK